MDSAIKKKRIAWWVRSALDLFWIVGYFSGVAVFQFEYLNYWASGGFSIVILFICFRFLIHRATIEDKWALFQPGGVFRIVYVVFFSCVGLAGIGLGFWLMSEGLKRHQSWLGDSYFCSMIGVWMAAKWAFFLTTQVYHIRADKLDEEDQARLRAAGFVLYDDAEHEPFFLEGGSGTDTSDTEMGKKGNIASGAAVEVTSPLL